MKYFKAFMKFNWWVWSIWMVVSLVTLLFCWLPLVFLFDGPYAIPSMILCAYLFIGMFFIAYDDGGSDKGSLEKWIFKKPPAKGA